MFRILNASEASARHTALKRIVPKTKGLPSGTAAALLCLCLIVSFILPAAFLLLGDRTAVDPSSFTRTAASPMPVIVLDPGHGGEDGGASGVSPVPEKDLNLALAVELCDKLQAKGFRVVMTRTTDTMLYDHDADFIGHKKEQDLAARAGIAENAGQGDEVLFVSLHMNSFPESKYRGLQVWFSENNQKSILLAQKIQRNIKNELQPANNRAVKPGGGRIFLLRKLTMPAVLIECGFLTNASDAKELNDPLYREKLASVLATAILQYAEETGLQTKEIPPAA